ncbi:hypothetical protein BJ875DRAFT_477021 [Amylocarpus encephaloides]|uniref:NmrA-like domain-containing protein n=1 Tax=Amylocarpus encephaloides TaxID=45428 RepID=A0A9P8BZT9_9HELO|nr:hypothetical protein BJ875DRAFT_477021 [Amylocarpus encephaloides]
MTQRTILITGSTGKQGKALIASLLSSQASTCHILALTRSSTSPAAAALLKKHGEDNLTIVEGNLNDEASVRRVFESQKESGGIWGVFCVLAYPGLGKEANGEEAQGKRLASLGQEYGVKCYAYSSAMRAGPKYEDQLKLSGRAKANIEKHCMELGETGLPWVILRPAFFMENFEDYIGSIAVGVMRAGLKEDTALHLIASEDIGHVAAGVFNNPSKYTHKILSLTSEALTMTQLDVAHKKATGKRLPSISSYVAWGIMKLNTSTRKLIEDIERNHDCLISGEYPSHRDEIALANEAFRMKTYAEWKSKEVEADEYQGAWNGVSFTKLVTGRL